MISRRTHRRSGDDTSYQHQRRRIIVQWPLQIKCTILIVALASLACFAVWWETYRSVAVMLERSGAAPSVLPLLGQINRFVLIKATLLLGLISIFSILITHYVAG